jgi:hypothetical protein
MLYTIIDSAVSEDSHMYLRVQFRAESEGIYLLPTLPQWYQAEDFYVRLRQLRCPHLHAVHTGSQHYNGAEVWDDVRLLCQWCGADLDHPDPNLFLH